MVKSLVIVESPTKVKTIREYLGCNYEVRASVGHVIDLPKTRMGVDLENYDFTPEYVPIKGKSGIISDIQKLSEKVDRVYLALDPDREGEAIAFHLRKLIRERNANVPICRVRFNEITKKSIEKAFSCPTELNFKLYDAQQARRILDRIVGYKISPILWNRIKKGLSAGRVQSVALRLVADREQEIRSFKKKEYWVVKSFCSAETKPVFLSTLVMADGKKIDLKNQQEALKVKNELETLRPIVVRVDRKKCKKSPSAAFITSKLQQEASRAFNFTAKKTMIIAQSLYEGIQLGDEGIVGLITYMRTDSSRINDEFVNDIRCYIVENYGSNFIPEKPNIFRKKNSSAQEAHEAIRPTSIRYTPDFVNRYLETDQYKLYKLIWERCLASQMSFARYDQTKIDIKADRYLFRSSGSVMLFEGFLKIYHEQQTEENSNLKKQIEEEQVSLPLLKEGDSVIFNKIDISQHFTTPPPRFSEASLVGELEKKEIGRPSTYASILAVIQDKNYVEKKDNKFFLSELGSVVSNLLVSAFPTIFDITFTAKMEKDLDKIEIGTLEWKNVLKNFYKSFMDAFTNIKPSAENAILKDESTDIFCLKCEKQKMVLKWGKTGRFLGCFNYPNCRYTLAFTRSETGTIVPEYPKDTEEVCKLCKNALVVRHSKYGSFLGCTAYPNCTFMEPISTGIKCPKCNSSVVTRKSKKGKMFYGCSSYPGCNFISWDKPVNKSCQNCSSNFLVEKTRPIGYIGCPVCEN